jgi:hypothetical protein
MIWLYVLLGFLYIWIFCIAMFRGKRNFLLFYVSLFLPFVIVALVLILALLIVFFPIIYIVLFIYSFFSPSMELNYVFKKFNIGKKDSN